MSIALTGRDETDLREFVEHLNVKPPLVNVLRQAVREFLVRRLDERSGYAMPRHKEWAAKFRRKYPPLRIIHDHDEAAFRIGREQDRKGPALVKKSATADGDASV